VKHEANPNTSLPSQGNCRYPGHYCSHSSTYIKKNVNVVEDGKNFVDLRDGQSLSKEFFIFGTKTFDSYTGSFSKEII
jgi:hypothetical protein